MFYNQTCATYTRDSDVAESIDSTVIWSDKTPANLAPVWEPGRIRTDGYSYELLGGLELLENFIGAGKHSIEKILTLEKKIPGARSMLFLVVEDRNQHSATAKKYSRNTVFSLVDGDFDLSLLDNRIDHGYFFTSKVEAMKRVFS